MYCVSKIHKFIIVFILLIFDYLAIIAAEKIVNILYYFMLSSSMGNKYVSDYNYWIVFPSIFIIIMSIEGLYIKREEYWRIIKRIFKSIFYAIAIITIFFLQERNIEFLVFIFLLSCMSFSTIAFVRYIYKRIVEYFDVFKIPILVVGAGKTAELLISGIVNNNGLGYKIIGLLEDNKVKCKSLEKYSVLGHFCDVEDIVKRYNISNIFIAAPGMAQDEMTKLIYRVQPMVSSISIIPNLIGVPMAGIEIESLFNEKLMIVKLKNNLAEKFNVWFKEIFDYVLTIIGTIIISPILIIISIWIYIDSPGPVIFKHRRIGKNGKEFNCYKFRSMCVDAKEKLDQLLSSDPEARAEWEKDFKLKNDPRITSSGAFLRKTSLDEIPQIFNVLRGEMSLVGPRPIIKDEMIRYGKHINDYLMVKPGITGMWQVSGRNDIDYQDRVLLDSWYVRNWSVWLDLVILVKTIKVVLLRKGAY